MTRPENLLRQMLPAGPEYRLSALALAATAFLAPFSASRLAGSATLGRTIAVILAISVAIDLLRARGPRPRLEKETLLAAASYVSLVGWIFASTMILGCNCDGKLGGFAEFAFVGFLALGAVSFEPRMRGLAMRATLAGVTAAAILALLGVGSLNSGTIDLTQTGGRLSGTYGNANELGFVLALAIPMALAYLPAAGRKQKLVLAVVALLLAAALLFTYSRGAIIAVTVGSVTVATLFARGNPRRLKVIAGGTAAAVLLAVLLYSFFERERQDASFASVPPGLSPLDQRDLSGWDSRALGPIPRGPSELSNRSAGIAVRSDRKGEGISYRWGEAEAGHAFTLRFQARAKVGERFPFSYGLGDRGRTRSGPVRTGALDSRWRTFELLWRPQRRAPHASLYVWQRQGPSTFLVADVEVTAKSGEGSVPAPAVPVRLEGSLYDHLLAAAEEEENLYIRSRLDAAELAVQAFGSSPLWGIGWATFPDYAAEHLDYGKLAAHDEYLSIAAELGIIGLALLSLLFAAAFLGARRAGSEPEETAAIGLLAAAAAGLVFVEALPVPQLSIPIAIGIAVLCARRPA